MDILDISPDAFVDIFAEAQKGTGTDAVTTSTDSNTPKFGMVEGDMDIFSTSPKATTPGADDKDKDKDKDVVVDDLTNANKSADILGDDKDKPTATTTTPEIKDIESFYKKGIEEGKFVAIEEEDDKGNKVQFVPKTFDDLKEVIDIQVNYKLEKEREQLGQQIYESKTPAWQAALKYAEMVDNPQDMIPFLQGIHNVESVANLDEKTVDDAEKIVRIGLEKSGQPKEAVDTQIEALKTTDKLLSTAEKLKPSILQAEQKQLAQMVQQRQAEEQQYYQMVQSISENAVKALEAPVIGKQILKKEEKAAIYDLIGMPNQQQGYQIFTAIDGLYEKGDFETLKLVALALTNKDSLINYISNHSAEKTAAGLERKLRAVDTGKGSGAGDHVTDTPVVHRNQFNSKPRFGRS